MLWYGYGWECLCILDVTEQLRRYQFRQRLDMNTLTGYII